MESLIAGFESIFSIQIILWIATGVTIGYIVGVLPGLGKGMAVAVAIPITFYITPIAAISFLIGIAKGSGAGSAVSAILLNTPGEPSSAPTALDGYPLARQGKAQKALKMGLFASVIGDFSATLILIVLAAPLAKYALLIGPVELFAILLFSLTFIAGLSGQSLIKGMIAGMFGILASCVGLEIETAVPRLTFDLLELQDGLSLIPVAIGMLAISEVIDQMGNRDTLEAEKKVMGQNSSPDDNRITWSEWKVCLPAILRGTLIGSAVGILPGLGASVGSFLSYGATKKASKTPERFGKGALEGVAAAESADNAVVPASLVPLFAIGIPGSVIAAILIAAFMIQGVTPGPLMFVQQPKLVAGIYAAMLCASLLLLVIGYFGQRLFAQVVSVPLRLILPAVCFLCVLGAFLQGGGIIGVNIMLVFGIIGFIAKKFDFSFVTFLIGFVIGPSFELTLRQSVALTGHSFLKLADHPIAILIFILTFITIWRFAVSKLKK
ncbi:MAG: Tricarboxylate transporter family protein [Deltaproteobacteria bacterium]|jgi:putative tricarboxylic transport membrane protein|nr:Tricarboxylate transporter family protein [Deltaproteobacteria bacterium]MBT4637744.1 Tricarboxylate transporter family protein [Deltaproteobacteria bacterium]MBT6499201.1 Tricarboxylate transporter family protein [Deltaproteobacteria bacterium]MBT6611244.1 Tricarboxylate transporter family protein [Deltaproteobacteria bacterium]MBT7153384.1 Tricarboxylate transporter family protein [Deltaproteobacteria bacterium]